MTTIKLRRKRPPSTLSKIKKKTLRWGLCQFFGTTPPGWWTHHRNYLRVVLCLSPVFATPAGWQNGRCKECGSIRYHCSQVGIVVCATSSSGAVTNAMDIIAWWQSHNDIDDDNNKNDQCLWCPSACCPRITTSWHGNCQRYWISLSGHRGILAAGIRGGVAKRASGLQQWQQWWQEEDISSPALEKTAHQRRSGRGRHRPQCWRRA